MQEKKRKVFVAMSGGVDSSVAALLLKNGGYNVTGVFIRCYNIDGCAERDASDARLVAEKIGIPFYVWDFEGEYKRRVVDYMVDGYKLGITPNPDVMCNREIKFGLFFDRARETGADYVATGHHVRLRRTETSNKKQETRIETKNLSLARPVAKRLGVACRMSLLSARDPNKDQSYFLWTLTQEKLRRCLFPIGDYFKSEVREIARAAGLPTAEKKDSQGICFLGKVGLGDFLRGYIPEKRGFVLASTGEKIGEHNGAHFYTIGQRHIGMANRQSPIANNGKGLRPIYVAEKNITENTITVAEGDDNPSLYKREIELADANFISPNLSSLIRANGRIDVFARVRYRQPLAKAKLITSNKKQIKTKNLSLARPVAKRLGVACRMSLIFETPQKFVASGQSAVFYLPRRSNTGRVGTEVDYEMLGGGVISSAI